MTLDRTYVLTKAGLSLHPGLPSSAVVETSTDGKHWTTIIDSGKITSFAMKYFTMDRIAARYVRVTVDDSNEIDGGAFLNEIELYSTIDSFENDAVGYVPRGYTDAIGATVSDENTNGDKHALRLADAWKDKIARATWVSEAVPSQDLSLRYVSMGYARTLSVTVNGRTTDGTPVAGYQIAQLTDGSITWRDTHGAWNRLTPAGAAPQKVWHSLRISATPAGAEIWLDGSSVGTIPASPTAATVFTGHTFSTTGTSATYDNFVIDDVEQR